jgi:transposase
MERKSMVFGAVERNRVQWTDGEPQPTVTRRGNVRAHVIPSRMRSTLGSHVERLVEKDGTTLYTDKAPVYDSMSDDGWNHYTIDHGARIYVRGDVHTQTIEGFWSLVKRGISGTHHAVSPKWLQGYLNEYVWRYNHRDDPRSMFALLLLRAATTTLPS